MHEAPNFTRRSGLLERLSNAPPVRLLWSRTISNSLASLTVIALSRRMRSRSLLLSLSLSERRRTIDTDKFTTVTFAILKATLLKLCTVRVVISTHHIINMRSPFIRIRPICRTEAELIIAHKVVPFFDLGPFSFATRDIVGIDETAFRVPSPVSVVWVEPSTCITTLDVETGEVANVGDLEEVGCFDELNTLNRAVGDQTSSIAGFKTVGDDGFFVGSSDDRVRADGSPETKVVDIVDEDVLSEGLRGRVTPFFALVATRLTVFPFGGEIVNVEVGFVLG